MHHQMSMGISARPRQGSAGLSGGCRYAEQGATTGYVENRSTRPSQGRSQLLHPGQLNRGRTTRQMVGSKRQALGFEPARP